MSCVLLRRSVGGLCLVGESMGLCLLVGVGGMVWRRPCGRIGW